MTNNGVYKKAYDEVAHEQPMHKRIWVAYKDREFKEFESKQAALEFSPLIEVIDESNEAYQTRVKIWRSKVAATYSTLLRNKYPNISVGAIANVIEDTDVDKHLMLLDLIDYEITLNTKLSKKPSSLQDGELVVMWDNGYTDRHYPHSIGKFKGVNESGRFEVWIAKPDQFGDFSSWDNCVRLSEFQLND